MNTLSKRALSKRNTSYDVICCVALLCILAMHFFEGTGFYEEYMNKPSIYFTTLLRNLFPIGIPLLLMLAGAQMRKQELSKAYYLSGLKILCVYVLASLACGFFRRYYYPEGLSLSAIFWSIPGFSTTPYCWYVEMFAGLFLLIPFLNLIYNNLDTDRKKLILVGTLVFLTALPGTLNSFSLSFLPAKLQGFAGVRKPLIPEWWTGIYPITYYFVGCYLSEHPLKAKKWVCGLLYGVSVLLFSALCVRKSYGWPFIEGEWASLGSVFLLVPAASVFLFFQNINCGKLPALLRKGFRAVAECWLGAILICYIFETVFSGQLVEKVPEFTSRLPYFFLFVPLVFVLSLACAYILNILCQLIASLLIRFKAKKEPSQTN
ncbi:MAG: acyltransferase family protein [Faecousia sp.]